MTAADLLTVGHADQWFRAILARVEAQATAAAPATAEVVLYSVPKLAQVLDVTPNTVRRWVRDGKEVRGRTIKLQAFHFTSEPRIPWPALLAYERGEDFDLATLPPPMLAPPEAVVPAEPPPLRLAS